uniref:Uncharacterized protein n=1 Tax=Anguilla anguilla TaxID=7936 RepID=A0A0E9XCP1_ANGAN
MVLITIKSKRNVAISSLPFPPLASIPLHDWTG